MAIQVQCNKVYKCQTPNIGAASIHVVSSTGDITIKGSNVTTYNATTKKLVAPTLAELADTGDTLKSGTISFITGLPEWFAFVGTGTIWVKMGVDARIEPTD